LGPAKRVFFIHAEFIKIIEAHNVAVRCQILIRPELSTTTRRLDITELFRPPAAGGERSRSAGALARRASPSAALSKPGRAPPIRGGRPELKGITHKLAPVAVN